MSNLANDLKQAKSDKIAEESKKKKKSLNIQVETSDKSKRKAAQNSAPHSPTNTSKKPVTITVEKASPDVVDKSRNKTVVTS